MKLRVLRKRAHLVVGTCHRCGHEVVNLVSNAQYKGSCMECDEDMFAFEIRNYRWRGKPVVYTNRVMRKLGA